MEPASHPFHVSHRTGAGELAGGMPGYGWELRKRRTQSLWDTAQPGLPRWTEESSSCLENYSNSTGGFGLGQGKEK